MVITSKVDYLVQMHATKIADQVKSTAWYRSRLLLVQKLK